ncbi:MAG TPA: hypothetical protein VMT00_10025 [Thermoanaerobaculia bacterium]|nr:hypothetical protein [Thermoanaerobaculia bacterium]
MRRVALVVIGTSILVVLVVGSCWAASERASTLERENRIERQQELETLYPEQIGMNETARELIALARSFGLEIEGEGGADEIRAAPFIAIRELHRDYLRAVITTADDDIAPPPVQLAEFLDSHRKQLGDLSTLLVESDLPRFPLDVSLLSGPEQPKFLGQVRVLQLLAVAALDEARTNRHQAAWRHLEAVWRVTRSLLERPEIPSQVVGITGARVVAGVARKLDPPVPRWYAEVGRFEYDSSLERALGAERVFTERLQTPDGGIFESLRRGEIRDVLLRPWHRRAAVRQGDAIEEAIEALPLDDICSFDVAAFESMLREAASLFPGVDPPSMPSLGGAVLRFANLLIDLEVTDRILASKEGESPARGRTFGSVRCPAARWIHESDSSGTLTIRFEGSLAQLDPPAWNLPRAHRISRR